VTGLIVGVRAGQETGYHPANEHDRDADDVSDDVVAVLAFLNTLDVEAGTDTLDDEARWRHWIAETDLFQDLPDTGDRDRARAARGALRASIGGVAFPSEFPGAFHAGPVHGGDIRVDLLDGVPTLVAVDPVGAALAAAARLAVLGQWDRMKICAAHDCQWAFYDRSRNRSRTWCSMRVCGNRTKARNWRERARAGVP
jgi:hypothetical protein